MHNHSIDGSNATGLDAGGSPIISISVISHNQAQLVSLLLDDIEKYSEPAIEVILTSNISEVLSFKPVQYRFPLRVVKNVRARGFAANHNSAFGIARGRYFCVINPDVRFAEDPFPSLIEMLQSSSVGVVAPAVIDPGGNVEDHARKFPTPLSILKKAFFRTNPIGNSVPSINTTPDWVAGMFMMFRSETFRDIRGFDERYFLYYEDVELCARLSSAGQGIRVCPDVKVIHEARRQSHREWRYFRWHLASMARFFLSRTFWSIWRHRLFAEEKPGAKK